MITEEMLCAAAARSCEIYVSYLERGYTPENQHEFSLQFEKKIKKLKRKADHPVFYHATKRIASIVLAILITGGVWIAVDAEARATFVGWVKEVYMKRACRSIYCKPFSYILPFNAFNQ